MIYRVENTQVENFAPSTAEHYHLNLLNLLGDDAAGRHSLAEEERMDRASLSSARKSHEIFQSNYCRLQENGITADTIRAIMQVEMNDYGIEDKVQDRAVCSKYGKLVLNEHSSVGPAQIQLRNFEELRGKFPAELGKYNHCDLVNQDVAALFVAAYLTKKAMDFENGNFVMETKVNDKFKSIEMESVKQFWQRGGEDRARALILSFNPRLGTFTHDFNHDGAKYLRKVRAEMGIETTVTVVSLPKLRK